MIHQKNNIKLIGRREFVNFPLLKIYEVEAKIDTGAYTSAIHCKTINLVNIGHLSVLEVKFLDETIFRFNDFTIKKIKNSFGEVEQRFVIKTIIKIGKKNINTTISLSDRANMRYPVLIGRRLLKNKFIVDVNQIYTNGISITY